MSIEYVMYDEQDYIQTAKDGFGFGHHGDYKYRVMGRLNTGAVHHTNCLDDAKKYFHKCREYWLEQDALVLPPNKLRGEI
jgi:hypothetical protein